MVVDLRQNAEARSIFERDWGHLLPVSTRDPGGMERGEGVYLFDSSGNRYRDLMAGPGVNMLRFPPPFLLHVDAILDLLRELVVPQSLSAANLETMAGAGVS